MLPGLRCRVVARCVWTLLWVNVRSISVAIFSKTSAEAMRCGVAHDIIPGCGDGLGASHIVVATQAPFHTVDSDVSGPPWEHGQCSSPVLPTKGNQLLLIPTCRLVLQGGSPCKVGSASSVSQFYCASRSAVVPCIGDLFVECASHRICLSGYRLDASLSTVGLLEDIRLVVERSGSGCLLPLCHSVRAADIARSHP